MKRVRTKKILITICGLVVVAFIVYGWRFMTTQENIKQLFVHAVCDTNALATYMAQDNIANHLDVYEQVRKDFITYNVEEWHLAHFARKNDVKLEKFVNRITDSIVEQCDNPQFPRSEVRDFVILMLGIAGSGLENLKARTEK